MKYVSFNKERCEKQFFSTQFHSTMNHVNCVAVRKQQRHTWWHLAVRNRTWGLGRTRDRPLEPKSPTTTGSGATACKIRTSSGLILEISLHVLLMYGIIINWLKKYFFSSQTIMNTSKPLFQYQKISNLTREGKWGF